MTVIMDLNTIGIDPAIYKVLREAAFRKYDMFHVLDSMSKHQMESKIWLVETVTPFVCNDGKINVQLYGGWIGFPLVKLMKSAFDVGMVENIDIDKESLFIFRQYMLAKGYEYCDANMDVSDHSNNDKRTDLVINTSSEHMPDMKDLIEGKRYGSETLFAIQSNNMHHIEEHINCVSCEDELIDKSGLTQVYYSGSIEMSNGYKRFMVVGYA